MKKDILYFRRIIKILTKMKQTIIFLTGLIAIILISLTSCKEETAKEETPETIAANLLKQGTADPELLLGEWELIKFAYTKDGNGISDREKILYGNPKKIHPTLNIPFAPTPIENEMGDRWCLNYYNSIWYICSLTDHLINLTPRGSTLVYAPVENVTLSAFRNAYSFVIKGNELIIYFKKGERKNLLILEKKKS